MRVPGTIPFFMRSERFGLWALLVVTAVWGTAFPAMKLLSVAFPEAKIVAVGNNARDLIESMGIRTAGTVRHPARGGATEFTTGLAQLAGS